MATNDHVWLEREEFEDADILWGWSNFDGREGTYNAEGEYFFHLIIPEARAEKMKDMGWPIRVADGYEEGDPPRYTLKVTISDRYELPMMYLIKNGRKFRVTNLKELSVIKRATCDRIDLIVRPSWWSKNGREGYTPYLDELYANVKQSRFADMYDDLEEA